jgi:hypothetical protein
LVAKESNQDKADDANEINADELSQTNNNKKAKKNPPSSIVSENPNDLSISEDYIYFNNV